MARAKTKESEELKWRKSGDYHGQTFYTRHGKVPVVETGFDGDKPVRVRVRDRNDVIREVSVSTLRSKAVEGDYRERYDVNKDVRTASGKPTIGVDDEITDKLRGKDLQGLKEVAEENDIQFKQYKHLNNGMIRMTIGNILRSRKRRDEKVKINGRIV